MIIHKVNFMSVKSTVQMQYFMVEVANFEPSYLSHFWTKIQSFCALWIRNFLNFSELTKLLSVDPSQGLLWAIYH